MLAMTIAEQVITDGVVAFKAIYRFKSMLKNSLDKLITKVQTNTLNVIL